MVCLKQLDEGMHQRRNAVVCAGNGSGESPGWGTAGMPCLPTAGCNGEKTRGQLLFIPGSLFGVRKADATGGAEVKTMGGKPVSYSRKAV